MSDLQPACNSSHMRTVRTFVLRGGRMTTLQERAYKTLYAQYTVPLISGCLLDYPQIFKNTNPVIAEIGFGTGEATAQIAQKNPFYNYLGFEVFKAGVGALLHLIDSYNLSNLRIIERDALTVFEAHIRDASLYAMHIFFPDPWHKKRHAKRRLLKRPRTDLLAKKLAVGGYIYVVTDSEEYAQEAYAALCNTQGLADASETQAFPWRAQTKFEQKALRKGRCIFELLFIKKELCE